MDGQAACTDHPVVAEVLKHVPVNSSLGSELRKEQSPGNGLSGTGEGGVISC